MPKFEKHIFICTNQRDGSHPRGSCDASGTGELLKLFKSAVASRGLKSRVRANKAGCMDQCEHGPTVAVYPEAVWYGGVTPADINEIMDEHIIGGRPVKRLMLADDCLNTERCPHRPRR